MLSWERKLAKNCPTQKNHASENQLSNNFNKTQQECVLKMFQGNFFLSSNIPLHKLENKMCQSILKVDDKINL